MIQNPTTEQPVPDCCYCEEPAGDKPTTTIGGSLIHKDCLEQMHHEMDPHREEPPADYEPTDDDWDACLQAYYGYGSGP